MSTNPRRRLAPSHAALAALAASIVAAAAPAARARGDAAGWTPALAALSDHAGSAAAAAPALAAPTGAAPLLAGAGMQAAAVAPEPAPPELAERTPEFTRDETERWVPGFAFTSGILGQNAEGSVGTDSTVTYNYFARQDGVSFFSNPPPAPCNTIVPSILSVTRALAEGAAIPFGSGSSTNFTRQPSPNPNSGPCNVFTGFKNHANVLPVSGGDTFLTPTVGASLEGMTPGLQDVPGRPRLFVHGDTALAFSFDRNVAKQGTPTGAVIPVGPITPEVEVRGTGAKTSGEVQTPLYSAGAGPAFTFEFLERRMRLRPSFEWMREEIQVSGVLNKTFQVDTGQQQSIQVGAGGANRPLSPLVNAVYLNQIEVRAQDTQAFNGIGGGLELEMDAARAGPVVLSLFLGGQAYKMLGNLDVNLTGQTVVPVQAPYTTQEQTVEANFDFHIHSWAYHGGAGLRFRWLPED